MHRTLEDYREIEGDEVISAINKKAIKLYGKHILHINSTYQGGGVAEKLASLVPLMNDVGLGTSWNILHGTPDFFTITKKLHNALQGEPIDFTEMKKSLYEQTNEDFSVYTHIDHNCVIVHDPQPLPLIKFCQKRQPWIWRCHIDLSNPRPEIWEYLKKFIVRYDIVIISSERYKRADLPVEQRVIWPASTSSLKKIWKLVRKLSLNILKNLVYPKINCLSLKYPGLTNGKTQKELSRFSNLLKKR